LYVLDVDELVAASCSVTAWRPGVPGITEVFHANIAHYAYPAHCHDTWTVLIVDAGAIAYDLDRRHCGASGHAVALLPPGVVHDGRPATGAAGFRKRVLYLDPAFLPPGLTGAAVDRTNLHDPALRGALSALHDTLRAGEEVLDGEGQLALIAERIAAHLAPRQHLRPALEPRTAHRLRRLLDDSLPHGMPLERAGQLLDRSVPHLVRSFTRTYGVSPHAYLIGRRIDQARRLLLRGARPVDVANTLGFTTRRTSPATSAGTPQPPPRGSPPAAFDSAVASPEAPAAGWCWPARTGSRTWTGTSRRTPPGHRRSAAHIERRATGICRRPARLSRGPDGRRRGLSCSDRRRCLDGAAPPCAAPCRNAPGLPPSPQAGRPRQPAAGVPREQRQPSGPAWAPVVLRSSCDPAPLCEGEG